MTHTKLRDFIVRHLDRSSKDLRGGSRIERDALRQAIAQGDIAVIPVRPSRYYNVPPEDLKQENVAALNSAFYASGLGAPAAGEDPHAESGAETLGGVEKSSEVDDALLGSSILPSLVPIPGMGDVQLGAVVRLAYHRSGLAVAQWNELPDETREDALQAAVNDLATGVATLLPGDELVSGD